MALPATDAFTRADGALGANYAYGPTGSSGTTLGIDNNQAFIQANSNTDVAAVWAADTFGNDQYSKIKVVSGMNSGLDYCAVVARGSGTGGSFTGYQFATDGASGAGHSEIQRWNASALTMLVAITTTVALGDIIEIRVSGSTTVTIEVFVNTVSVGSITDNSGSRIASGGGGGFGGYSSAVALHMDDFEAGNLSGGGGLSSVIATPRYSTHFLF